jgi:hypothetical protein
MVRLGWVRVNLVNTDKHNGLQLFEGWGILIVLNSGKPEFIRKKAIETDC